MLWQGRQLEAALPRALRKLEDPSDRGLARAIAGTVLRWLPDLDALIDARTKKPLPEDARARMVLRMALAQALKMETPPHAVIATALPLVAGGPRRLVHGVLAGALRSGGGLPEVPALPPLWGERWTGMWGADVAAAAARALAEAPPIDVTLRDEADAAALADALGGDAVSLLPGHLRTSRGGRIEEWPGFAEGAWWVQDLAASLPARLLAARTGERILDLCAAPGGKALQLAAAGADVTAVDSSGARLERLRDNLGRTHLKAEIVEADARNFRPDEPFDAVLLDAPCSATGTFRRHPDVLYLRDPAKLEPVLQLQAELLDHAAALVKSGGRMVYAVCSLEREEGEAQIAAVLQRTPGWTRGRMHPPKLLEGLAAPDEGALRTLPNQLEAAGGLDSFYMALLVRG